MCHLARKLCMSSFSNYFWPSGKKESMCVISKPHKVKLNACMSITSWLFRLVQRQNYVQKLHLFRARYRVKSGTCTVEVQWIKKPKRCWLCFTYLTLISLFELSACFFFKRNTMFITPTQIHLLTKWFKRRPVHLWCL